MGFLCFSGDFWLSLGPYCLVPSGKYLDYFFLGFWKANPRRLEDGTGRFPRGLEMQR